MNEDLTTKPSIETVLERINALGDMLAQRISELSEKTEARFNAVDSRFAAIDVRFDSIDARFNAVDARFDAVDIRLNAIDARFGVVESRLNSIDSRLDRFGSIILDLRADIRDWNNIFKSYPVQPDRDVL